MRNVKKIVCNICGQNVSASNYSKHIRRHQNHPETFKETYQLDHDDLYCKFCGKECKNKNSLTQHELRCSKNPNRKVFINPNFNNQGRVAWNKGLTKETDERVRKNAESRVVSYQVGKSIRRTGDLNVSRRIEVKQKISQTCLTKSRNGEWHKSLAKNMHYSYNGVDLDGKWELYYAIYLDEHDIDWKRCSERFPYQFENTIHYYTPDFYLVDSDTFVEIKGYETEKDRAKWEQFPEDKNLLILKEKELRELGVL